MTDKPQVDFTEVVKASGMPVTDAELKARFTDIAAEEGLITNTSRMSPFWRLVTAIITAPVLWLADVMINTVLVNMFVATAGGQMLRLLAWAVNVTPKPASRAEGVIRFTKESAGADVTVQAGTRIQTERINGVIYELVTVADFTIPAGEASALIPVRASDAGAAWNLAPGYYRILPVAVTGITQAESEEDWLSEAGAAAGLDVLKAQLAAFGQKRDAMLAEIATGLSDLQGKSARAWVFTGGGDVVTTLTQLARDIPQPSAVYSAAVMLVGDNLEGIKGMIHEYKPDAGA